jgi:hypothetical protein
VADRLGLELGGEVHRAKDGVVVRRRGRAHGYDERHLRESHRDRVCRVWRG